MSLTQNLRDFLYGVAYGRYEREMKLQAAELNDYFLLLCYMEVVGCPIRRRSTCSRSTRTCSSSSTCGIGAWAWTARRSAACPAAERR